MTFKIVSTLVASLPALVLGFWWIVSPRSYMRLMLRHRLKYYFIPWPSPKEAESRSWRSGLRILGVAILAFVSLYYYAAYYNLSRR